MGIVQFFLERARSKKATKQMIKENYKLLTKARKLNCIDIETDRFYLSTTMEWKEKTFKLVFLDVDMSMMKKQRLYVLCMVSNTEVMIGRFDNEKHHEIEWKQNYVSACDAAKELLEALPELLRQKIDEKEEDILRKLG